MGDKMTKKSRSKSKQKIKSALFTIILAVIVISILIYLIMGEQSKDAHSGTAAIVNGEKITQAELEEEYSKLPLEYRSLISKEDMLSQLIDKKLLMQRAKSEGISVSEDEIQEQMQLIKQQFPNEESFNQILEQQNLTVNDIEGQIREQLLINKLLNQTVISKIEISEQAMIDYYEENVDQFTASEEEIRAAHILVESEAEAGEVIELLEAGESFEELAAERSRDPSARTNMGNLGFFSKGTMVEEFEEVAFALEVGEISDPVETSFGYHVIKRLSDQIPMEEARDEIENSLLSDVQSEKIEEYLAVLREEAQIQTDTGAEKIIGNEFKDTGDEVCFEGGKPIIRRYTSSNCAKCREVESAFRQAAEEFDVVVKEWELDTGDNLNTAETESAMPKYEYEILREYNPGAAVPAYVFGCKYARIGNANLDLDKEELVFRQTLERLT
ncbi:hypothetical protein GF323_06485 [Candidatus Woesearchaeota archaeon]|nr:hypothetical protein [Candidatus Woesearchaeota archaeon]